MMVPNSKVLREGRVVKISSEKIVPGDILVLDEGDKIMADARIVEISGLKVNEASLTGESVSVEKVSYKLTNHVALGDRLNMVFQGTSVVGGSAKVVVVNTGMETELGKISELVQEIKSEKNPFRDKLDRFAKKIGVFIIVLSVLIVLLLILTGADTFQSLLVAVSLAVSAIPEGLPAVISLGLAFATRRMIKKNVLIRKLPASETLGRTTVICTDKTGTLTEEEMHVSDIYTNGKLNPHNDTEMLFKTGVLCNNSRLVDNENGEYFLGDPTEVALIDSAKHNFIDKNKLERLEPKTKEFAFSSERKMMSVIRRVDKRADKKFVSYVKGAPEEIVSRCGYELINGRRVKLSLEDRKRLIKVYEAMARNGLRVLGFAYKQFRDTGDRVMQDYAESNLVFVGFQGMIDPPRKEVKNAIKMCNSAGIKVLMITGDSKLTAEAVAKEIGLEGDSVGSKELQEMSNKELFDKIKDVSVFSRISPQDKLRIVNILKQRNDIVAMTGDGVNDALALKRADIGIAMGIRGTDVARDSSDIVLVDDNFASIVEGVREGRTVYDNTKKFIKYLLSANFYEVFFVLSVMLIWRNPELLPLLPLQILWINLVTDSLPALALSAEKMEKDVMKRKPSKQELLKGIKGFIVLSGIIGLILISIGFFMNLENIDKARTMAVLALTPLPYFPILAGIFKMRFVDFIIYAIFPRVIHMIGYGYLIWWVLV